LELVVCYLSILYGCFFFVLRSLGEGGFFYLANQLLLLNFCCLRFFQWKKDSLVLQQIYSSIFAAACPERSEGFCNSTQFFVITGFPIFGSKRLFAAGNLI